MQPIHNARVLLVTSANGENRLVTYGSGCPNPTPSATFVYDGSAEPPPPTTTLASSQRGPVVIRPGRACYTALGLPRLIDYGRFDCERGCLNGWHHHDDVILGHGQLAGPGGRA